MQNPNETSKIQNSTQEESDIQEATETSQVQNLNKGKEMQYEQSRENTTTVLPLKGMKRNATTKLKSKAAKLSEPRVVLFKLRSTRKENELNDKVSGGNDKLSGGSDKLSSGNDKVSGGNDKVSGGNDKVSGGNDKVSGGNDKVSGGNDKVSGGNDKVSVGLSAKMVKEEEEADQDLSSTCVRNSFKQKSQETCDFCLKEFLTQDSLDSHLKTADGWRCCLCRQEFQDKDKLTSHQQIHEATFECSECDKVFRRPLQLEDHIEVEHLKKTETKKGEYPCSRCGYVFKFEMHLEKHNQTMPECKPEMTNEEILKLRRLEQISFHDPVTGEFRKKTYKQLLANNAMKCEICLKTFEKQNILRVHLVSHSDSTPYTCYICNTSFKLNYRLAKHMKKHDARPYNCSLCAKTFSTEARRNNHVTSLCDFRKPIPDLECTACGYSFVSR